MFRNITVLAPAKLNLTLDVTGLLPNGYHAVSMVLQSVDLCDRITVSQGERGISVSCREDLPQGEGNIVHRAATAFLEAIGQPARGIDIGVEKAIPVAAGLGGGSADAAAVLLGLNHGFGHPLSEGRLLEIAAGVGADVPFCLSGGTALVEGFGEKITSLPSMPDCFLVLLHAGEKDSTGAMYQRLDGLEHRPKETTEAMVSALEQGDLSQVLEALGNAFDGLSNQTIAGKAKALLSDCGALRCNLSGSGPTVYGVFLEEESARIALEKGQEAGFVSHLCRPLPYGCRVIRE